MFICRKQQCNRYRYQWVFKLSRKDTSFKYIRVESIGYKTHVACFSDTIININLEEEKPKKGEKEIKIGKPIIYLYPNEETKVNIKLHFNGKITTSYPLYDSLGWNVMAKPNSEIKNIKDNRFHSYLYWAGETSLKHPKYNNDGFVVKRDSIIDFLESELSILGMTNKESNDFISYWIPYLTKEEYVFMHFLVGGQCDPIARLAIFPKPANEIRVYMVYRPLEARITTNVQSFHNINKSRKGFVVVEWGGMELDGNSIK